jgi:hypothetical protein
MPLLRLEGARSSTGVILRQQSVAQDAGNSDMLPVFLLRRTIRSFHCRYRKHFGA